MITHHIQKTIVTTLASSDGLRFSELKPESIENKLFNYHLKKSIQDGLIEKTADGLYKLSVEGKRLGLRALSERNSLSNSAYSVLFLVVKQCSEGPYLVYKRLNQPLRGQTGFMHTIPDAEQAIAESARQALRTKTGLSGTFKRRGGGIFRIYDNDQLESFTHFELLVCDKTEGQLQQLDANATYTWVESLSDLDDQLPNMPSLTHAYLSGQEFFLEERLVLG